MTSRSASPDRIRARGFTLTELAIVVVIVGFLIGGLLVPLATQMDVRRVAETQRTLELARDALLGYAVANGRLPCPAAPATTGAESPAGGGACTNSYDGFLPAVTLGITPTDALGYAIDAWGNRIRYAVPNITVGTTVNPFTTANGVRAALMGSFVANKLIYVCASASVVSAIDCGTATTLGNTPALMYSLGKNAKTAGNDADEAANLNADVVFVAHDSTPAGSVPAGEFDDIVVYLSLNQLFNRMVAGGALP